MGNLFSNLFAMSIAGSVVVGLMLLLRPVTAKIFSAKWQYGIGKMAIALYLFPVFLFAKMLSSVQPVMESYPAEPSIMQKALPALPSNGFTDAMDTLMKNHFTVELMQALLLIWFVGAMIFAAWHFYCYHRFSKQLRADSFPVPDDAAALLSSCKAALGIHSDVKLMLNLKIASPMLVGLRRPMILLPTSNVHEIDLKLVLTHELMHLKRKDLWVKMLALTAETLNWFNPFAHVLCKNISIWGELSCDEALASKMSHAERIIYGEAILNTLDNHSGINTAFCSALCSSKKHIERRLTMLVNVKKMKKHIVVFAVVAIVAIACIGTAVASIAAEYDPDKCVPDGAVSWVAYDDERGAGRSEDSQTQGNSIMNAPQNSVELGNNQVLYFDTQEELDAHLEILAERSANGLDPYEGFEELYANIDFNYPIAYTVGGLVPVCPAN